MRLRCQNGTPQVRQDIAKLCHCEGLRRSVVVLRHGVDTVHSKQFSDFFYEHLIFVHRLFRDPNKGLMGVHKRVYERENILYLTAEAK